MSSFPPFVDGPLVVRTRGHTPRLWHGESVIYFANVLAGFFDNEALSEQLKREISGAVSPSFHFPYPVFPTTLPPDPCHP